MFSLFLIFGCNNCDDPVEHPLDGNWVLQEHLVGNISMLDPATGQATKVLTTDIGLLNAMAFNSDFTEMYRIVYPCDSLVIDTGVVSGFDGTQFVAEFNFIDYKRRDYKLKCELISSDTIIGIDRWRSPNCGGEDLYYTYVKANY